MPETNSLSDMQEADSTTIYSGQSRNHSGEKPSTEVQTVGDFLLTQGLTIPTYQRPYKWTKKHVNQLIEDLHAHRDKNIYRLGTIITHDHDGRLDIVDGQQRVVTFLLIHLAIRNTIKEGIEEDELKRLLDKVGQEGPAPTFKSDTSKANVQANYREIERQVKGLDESTVDFIFNRCEVIHLTLDDISEAFQFFDSQNARGRDLEPHDLLKAYHLREFSEKDEPYKKQVVDTWESMDTGQLSRLFSTYLYRVKGWIKGESAKYFTKNDTGHFKGVNPDNTKNYPYTQFLSIIHFFVDGYNTSYERNIDRANISFPFQLDQPVIDGRRFFEMIGHYHDRVFSHLDSDKLKERLDKQAKAVIETLDSYNGRKRIGDAYARMLFDCALLYYVDKFGHSELSRAVEKLFVWSYSLRLRYQVLSLASVDNYVVKERNVFQLIKDAIEPKEVLSIDLEVLTANNVNSRKSSELIHQFKKLGYYADN